MKLPIVISSEISAEKAVLHLSIAQGSEPFAGHFPGSPILPGVVQVDWAIRCAHEYLKAPQVIAKDFKVKFNRIISPEMPLILELVIVNNKLNFSYHVNGEQMSSGQIKL